MAQLETLHEELPQVLIDAASQQAEWNRFRLPLPAAVGTATPARTNGTRYAEYQAAPGFVDPALATVAALETISRLQVAWAAAQTVLIVRDKLRSEEFSRTIRGRG